jgi:dTDP-4-dehydrorhamnose reductase
MSGVPICRALSGRHEVIATGRGDLDVTDAAALRARLERERPDWVVHLAALTDVDRCQREPRLGRAVNAGPVGTLASWCAGSGAGVLLLSSIAVFDGRQASPYVEGDAPSPANAYGASKWEAEGLASRASRHLVVRTGWLFAGDATDRKFVGRILERARERESLDVVSDRFGSPTSVHDLAEGIRRLLEEDARGLVHLVNEGGPVSRVELAREAIVLAGLATRVHPVSSEAFPDLAPRPAMEAARSARTAGWLRPWRDALRDALGRR